MRNLFTTSFLLLFFSASIAGVVKESKTSVNFSGFGKYITVTSTKMQGLRKLEDSEKEFKGEGFMGSLTAKFILKPGHEASLTALDEMKLYSINHEKEEYTIRPIKKFEYDRQGTQEAGDTEYEETESNADESNIRVVRNEFKVNATGEKKMINNFPCEKYVANWIFEWENTETDERGIDSLVTVVWTTKPSSEMEKAQQEEMDFNKEYLNKIGFEMNEVYDDILGTRWMELFSQLSQSRAGEIDENAPDFMNEMKKIEGYPVVTDGRFFVIVPNQNSGQTADDAQQDETPEPPKSLNGLFGGLMKKAMQSKDKSGPKEESDQKAAFSFYNELIKIETKNLNPRELTIPADYEEVSGSN